jgi:hypothetical protein
MERAWESFARVLSRCAVSSRSCAREGRTVRLFEARADRAVLCHSVGRAADYRQHDLTRIPRRFACGQGSTGPTSGALGAAGRRLAARSCYMPLQVSDSDLDATIFLGQRFKALTLDVCIQCSGLGLRMASVIA